ncbi:MarR family winged helix-turn-helix transcriptional regulator [Paenibacillus sp. PL91]|uniref:MarR family winged helix-turn-helix transcriptional regulator n=1 Tax=Paenibacillus sp. PL91 TaxID=2729538 RepID=UPI00145C8003|nr:MarR family transcriptional regulator [Paenibacillus sp. PL91]MBC9201205.1 MarR family transcriptional regulator [Paenibacillus sp. PL91]
MNEYDEWKELFPLLKGVYKKLKAEWYKGIDCSFSVNQTRMIQYLDRQSPMKSTELAEMLFITAGGVTLIGDKLVERGLIRRYRGDEDKRVVYLEITDEGKQYIKSFEENDEAIIRYMSERVSQEDLAHLRRIFSLFND